MGSFVPPCLPSFLAGTFLAGNDEPSMGELLIRGGASGTIAAVVNALAKAGIELDGNGGVVPGPKGKPR